MKYSEIFHTIQGEGVHTGVPSVFFRTSYCNLRCIWCDTPYTSWQPENKDISIDDAVKEITQYDCEHVVITGGEPYIQKNELPELCERLVKLDHYLTIETNGTIYYPTAAQFISLSPKLSNSAPDKGDRFYKTHELLRINLNVIHKFVHYHYCQIKFVVDNPEDFIEIADLQRKLSLRSRDIVLMAQGRSAEELACKQKWLIELCKKHNFRFSPRIHVDIWGNTRGV